MKSSKIFAFILMVCVMCSCVFRGPEAQIRHIADQYEAKKISNFQMLLAMGEVYFANPENAFVKATYFNRMIISGYSSWALHYFLENPESIQGEEEEKIILFALRKGNHYGLAYRFNTLFSHNGLARLHELRLLSDSLHYYNERISTDKGAGAYIRRAGFFNGLAEKDMSDYDLAASLRSDPCDQDAIFLQTLKLFELENARAVRSLLKRCPSINTDVPEWYPVFSRLADELLLIEQSDIDENERLFKSANLYVNNGFHDIALRKSAQLVLLNPDHADYLALHAFVYYRKGDRRNAEKFLNQAEQITGQPSRLRSLIDQMN